MLAVQFETREEFARQFVENISKGGLFVPTQESFELRSTVEIGIDLSFCGEQVLLEGEVVHCIPKELASAGAVPGIAVQFSEPIHDLRKRFEPFLGEDIDVLAQKHAQTVRAQENERRKTPRETARVHARITTPNGEELEGLTRDLSDGGILFSIACDPLAIGTDVDVVLLNPVTGEEIGIPGEVVRHLKDAEGRIPAIGIRFDTAEEQAELTRAFIERLRVAEHNRRLGGISGDIAELGIANLLQSFGQSSEVGTITMICGPDEGYIAFSRGTLLAARLGRARGQKALTRLLTWTDGRFEFHARVDPHLVKDQPIQLDRAILEALSQDDELKNLGDRAFDPETCFRIDRDLLQQQSGDMGKLEGAIVDLVSVDANVRKLLDVIPESDVNIQRALLVLVDVGLLTPC